MALAGVPVTVKLGNGPGGDGGAFGSALSVRVVVLPVAGFGLNDACTPAGRPDAVNVTPPFEPLKRRIAIVSVTCDPCTTAVDPLDTLIAKSAGTPPGLSNVRSSTDTDGSLEVTSNATMFGELDATEISVWVPASVGTATVLVATTFPSTSYPLSVTAALAGGLENVGVNPAYTLTCCALSLRTP